MEIDVTAKEKEIYENYYKPRGKIKHFFECSD